MFTALKRKQFSGTCVIYSPNVESRMYNIILSVDTNVYISEVMQTEQFLNIHWCCKHITSSGSVSYSSMMHFLYCIMKHSHL